MFQHIIIGQYIDVSSSLHRLDARSKLISAFLLIITIFLANNWYAYIAVILFAIAMVILSNVPLSYILKGLKPIFLLVLLTILLHLFLNREGEIIFSIGSFHLYEKGLIEGTFISIRLFSLILFTSLVTLTTNPIDLTDGLEQLFKPFRKIGLPAHELALMTSIALRFIPTFLQETEKIMKAQMARGVDFRNGPIRERVKALFPLLIPLFMSAFKRAEELAVAMEARGYKGADGRTKFRQLTWTWRDTVAIVIILLFGLLIIFLRTGL